MVKYQIWLFCQPNFIWFFFFIMKVYVKIVPKLFIPEKKNIGWEFVRHPGNLTWSKLPLKCYYFWWNFDFPVLSWNQCQSMHENSPASPQKKRSTGQQTLIQAMIFFQGIIYQGHTVNQVYYTEVSENPLQMCKWNNCKCGRKCLGFFTKATHHLTTPFLSRVSHQTQDPCDGKSPN